MSITLPPSLPPRCLGSGESRVYEEQRRLWQTFAQFSQERVQTPKQYKRFPSFSQVRSTLPRGSLIYWIAASKSSPPGQEKTSRNKATFFSSTNQDTKNFITLSCQWLIVNYSWQTDMLGHREEGLKIAVFGRLFVYYNSNQRKRMPLEISPTNKTSLYTSVAISEYSRMRSTDTMLDSSSLPLRTIQLRLWVIWNIKHVESKGFWKPGKNPNNIPK